MNQCQNQYKNIWFDKHAIINFKSIKGHMLTTVVLTYGFDVVAYIFTEIINKDIPKT